jgi:Bacterial SH3 domain
MQLARLLGGVGVLLAGAALAAQGDALLVTGSNVNVRAGPSTEAGILTRVGADEPAIERRRQGQWVEVELPDQDVLGWIHDSLLAVVPDQAAHGKSQAGQPQPADAAEEIAALDPVVPASVVPDAAATDIALDVEEADATPLGRFRREVQYFNDRAVAAAGVDLFTGVAQLGEGDVQVMTTEAWATMSQPGQQSYLNALFGSWQAAAGADRALRLEVVDSNGALMMEKSGP